MFQVILQVYLDKTDHNDEIVEEDEVLLLIVVERFDTDNATEQLRHMCEQYGVCTEYSGGWAWTVQSIKYDPSATEENCKFLTKL